LEKQRELLAWEKKLQMAQETKQNTKQEREKEGDIGAMKAEIHRMEVPIQHAAYCSPNYKLICSRRAFVTLHNRESPSVPNHSEPAILVYVNDL
jgi:hypothetical protein